jgi:hypothetical protein
MLSIPALIAGVVAFAETLSYVRVVCVRLVVFGAAVAAYRILTVRVTVSAEGLQVRNCLCSVSLR